MDDALTGSKPSVADGRSSSRLGGATDHQVEETEVLLGEGVSARKPVVAQASSRYHHYHFSHLNANFSRAFGNSLLCRLFNFSKLSDFQKDPNSQSAKLDHPCSR